MLLKCAKAKNESPRPLILWFSPSSSLEILVLLLLYVHPKKWFSFGTLFEFITYFFASKWFHSNLASMSVWYNSLFQQADVSSWIKKEKKCLSRRPTLQQQMLEDFFLCNLRTRQLRNVALSLQIAKSISRTFTRDLELHIFRDSYFFTMIFLVFIRVLSCV